MLLIYLKDSKDAKNCRHKETNDDLRDAAEVVSTDKSEGLSDTTES